MLQRLALQYPLEISEVNILADKALSEAYGARIPVVDIEGGKLGNRGRLEAPIAEAQLRDHLESALRAQITPANTSQVREWREPAVDRFIGYISQHWLRFVSIAVGIFVGLPWLAPVFAALGWWGLADPIYTAYAVT